tara:strand:+ start:5897 stop:6190 length:294 start_codon:yes stop_codon:yes gene_type:complete
LTSLSSTSYCAKIKKNGGLEDFVSKLDEAAKRLQKAVTALEKAARTKSENERAALSGTSESDLSAARDKAGDLEALNASVAERLDLAILRVKDILDK